MGNAARIAAAAALMESRRVAETRTYMLAGYTVAQAAAAVTVTRAGRTAATQAWEKTYAAAKAAGFVDYAGQSTSSIIANYLAAQRGEAVTAATKAAQIAAAEAKSREAAEKSTLAAEMLAAAKADFEAKEATRIKVASSCYTKEQAIRDAVAAGLPEHIAETELKDYAAGECIPTELTAAQKARAAREGATWRAEKAAKAKEEALAKEDTTKIPAQTQCPRGLRYTKLTRWSACDVGYVSTKGSGLSVLGVDLYPFLPGNECVCEVTEAGQAIIKAESEPKPSDLPNGENGNGEGFFGVDLGKIGGFVPLIVGGAILVALLGMFKK